MFPALSVNAVQQTFGAPRQLPLKKSSAKIAVTNDGVVPWMLTCHPKDLQNHDY
jgi:hypothetical protein